MSLSSALQRRASSVRGVRLRRPPHPVGTRVTGPLPGLLLVAALAAVALTAAMRIDWLQRHGIGALTLAIVLGIVVGNTVPARAAAAAAAGVTFSKQTLLRLGIVLYGLRLTFQDIGHVGLAGVVVDALVLSSTFAWSCWLGTRVLGLDRRTAMLIGAGSSICGAAAVMATEPVVEGRAEQVAVAVSTVVVFGTVAIFLYPALFRLVGEHGGPHLSPRLYGLYAGSTIHEVAQVVAAARAVGGDAANTAVIAKMVRVMMLSPFLIALSAWLARHPLAGGVASGAAAPGRIVVPWFALVFVAVAGVNSLHWLPPALVDDAIALDTFLLAMAMAALGLSTHVSAIRTAGARPLVLAASLFAWLVVGGFGINLAVTTLLA